MRPLKALAAPLRAFLAVPKLVLTFLFITSLALNIATLTVSGVFSVASAGLSALGVSTVAAREAVEKRALQSKLRKAEKKSVEIAARRKVVKQIGIQTADSAKRRAQRGAARNISSAAGEAIPIVGVAVIAAALALEVQDACETAKEMAGFKAAVEAETDPEAAQQEAMDNFDCVEMIREEIPDYDDLPSKGDIWNIAKSSPGYAWEQARKFGIDIVEVDWSGMSVRTWEGVMNTTDSTVDWLGRGIDWLWGEEGEKP